MSRRACAALLLAGACTTAPPAPPPTPAQPVPRPEPVAATPPLPAARPEEVGMDPAALARVDSIIERAIRDGATPGAALAVGRHGRLVRLRGYGTLDWADDAAPATDSSLYDLASLTKVVGTTTAAMILYEEGKLDLDAPLTRYLPEWRPDGEKARVTVRHLLTHSSGLPAYGPLWQELRGTEAYVRRIGALALDYPPGTRTVYSDFGIILLGAIVERLAGQPLDRFLETRVFQPLGMHDTRFNPLATPTADDAQDATLATPADAAPPPRQPDRDRILERIAPTERDTIFRKTHLRGVVHDENAYAMGGVAGHAGLFSSARDLAIFAQFLLDGGRRGELRLLRPETIELFTRRQDPRSSRALGWDTPSPGSSAGDYFSTRSFGHTGFTGTSIWIDPERDLFVVLLTNRVNPTRANQKHVPLRRAVHDAAQLAITDTPVRRRDDGARGRRRDAEPGARPGTPDRLD